MRYDAKLTLTVHIWSHWASNGANVDIYSRCSPFLSTVDTIISLWFEPKQSDSLKNRWLLSFLVAYIVGKNLASILEIYLFYTVLSGVWTHQKTQHIWRWFNYLLNSWQTDNQYKEDSGRLLGQGRWEVGTGTTIAQADNPTGTGQQGQ